MKIKVDRKNWDRGYSSYLYDGGSGRCCIIGFACADLGISRDAMNSFGCPSNVLDHAVASDLRPGFSAAMIQAGLVRRVVASSFDDSRFVHVPTEFVNRAIQINDNEELTEAEREAKLVQLFENHGHCIEFEG